MKKFAILLFGLHILAAAEGQERHQQSSGDFNGYVDFSLLQLPKPLSLIENKKLTSAYEKTKCSDLNNLKKKENVGVICISTNRQLLNDMGLIEVVDSAPSNTSTEKERRIVVGTPIGQYDMQIADGGAHILVAEVDCDTKNGNVYRPTASCLVALITRSADQYIYGNFVLRDHVTKKSQLTRQMINTLVNQLADSK